MLVIGSGPAGVSCAIALLEQGHTVTMVDAGLTLEPAIQSQVDALARQAPSAWPKGAVDFMSSSTDATVSGVSLKRVFGSDFAYRGTEKDIPLSRHNTGILPSFAKGGLSTVWGAAMLPLQSKDLAGWPISLADLEPHYRAVLRHVPLAAIRDDLEKHFPLYTENARPLDASRQAQGFLSDLEQNRERLNAEHIIFGHSRLAVHAPHKGRNENYCVYCSLCLCGCPYGAIYSASHTLEGYLKKQPRFHYFKGWIAKQVSENQHHAELLGTSQDMRRPQVLTGERVFLAGGVLSTTKILLYSMKEYDRPLHMATSQHFMFPWIRLTAQRGVTEEALHTLAQIFFEIDDPDISQHTVHLQFYTYNSLMREALRRIGIGYLVEASAWMRDALYGRLLVTQGYLHSKDSPEIEVTLKKPVSGDEPVLDLRGSSASGAKRKIQLLLKKLSRLRQPLCAIPIPPLLHLSPPGGGYHAGGTFPMRQIPQAFESDLWGRPYGFERVHAVDASILPEIPGTAITMNVMANAHRIGSFNG